MSQKTAKKIRQLFRREVGDEAKKIGNMIANSIKPKPLWIPMWLWMKLISLFINIKKV